MEQFIIQADNVICKLAPKIASLLTFQTNLAQSKSRLLFTEARRESGLGCYMVPARRLRHKVAWCTARIKQDRNQISRYPWDDPSWSKAQVLFVWLGPLSVYLRYARVFFCWARSSHPVWRQGWCPLIYCRAADFQRLTTQPSRT